MSDKVKWFNTVEHTQLGTWHNTDAGSIIGILKACLCDGFNLKTVTTLTRSGSVANVYISTGHGFTDKQVVLIAGANETEYNGEFSITYVDANNFTYTVAGTPATPATGTITSKAAPLGWTALYSSSEILIARAPDGEQVTYRFYEPATGLTAYDNAGNVDTANYRAVEVKEVVNVTGLQDYVELCRGYFYKGITDAGTQAGNHLFLIGDGKSFYLMVTDPYDKYIGYSWLPVTNMTRFVGFYFLGELVVPYTYAQLPFRSIMGVDSGYSQSSAYGYDWHSEIGPQGVNGAATGNAADTRYRTGKGFTSYRPQQPLVTSGSTGNAYKTRGIVNAYLLSMPYTGALNQGGVGYGGTWGGFPWVGQQDINLSTPVWVCENAAGILGRMPGMYSLSKRTGAKAGTEFVSPFAAMGATNRTGILVRGMVEQLYPSTTVRSWALGTAPNIAAGSGEMTASIAFDITGPWR